MPQVAAAAIMAGYSMYAAKKARKAQQPAIDMMRRQGEVANELSPYQRLMTQNSERAMNPALDYWAKLLTGDRGEMMQMLAPEVEQIQRSYGDKMRLTQELSPRGGGTTAFFGELPYKQAEDISSLFAKVRPLAAQNLQSLAGTAGGLGLNAAGIRSGAYRDSGQGLFNSTILQQNSDSQTGEALGELMQQIISKYGKK